MIVTIDGPAGAGKSSVSRELAWRLGFRFLDTGAMYRAITLAALRANIGWHDSNRLVELAEQCDLVMDDEHIWLNRVDVTDDIRALEVTRAIHHIADHPEIRGLLVEKQRQIASQNDYVTEGRDQGTVAFPNAECKIFLTASPLERARRRQVELQQKGKDVGLDQILREQNDRDHRDSTRPVGRLMKADDAVEVVTDGMLPEQVLDHLERLVRTKQAATESQSKA
jgi:CMP/dCMP kinase